MVSEALLRLEANATVAVAIAVTWLAPVDEKSCDIASTTESSNKEVELKQEVYPYWAVSFFLFYFMIFSFVVTLDS